MKNALRRRPSAAMVVAIAALVLAASGTAVAGTGLVSGNSIIKKHSLSGNRLMNHTITGKQVNLNKLGTVPNANFATTAGSATSATSATTAGSAPIAKLTYVSSTVSIPNSGPSVAATATCPAGTNVVGGGAQVASEPDAYVNDTYPNGKSSWTADFYTYQFNPTTGTVTAICAPAAATG